MSGSKRLQSQLVRSTAAAQTPDSTSNSVGCTGFTISSVSSSDVRRAAARTGPHPRLAAAASLRALQARQYTACPPQLPQLNSSRFVPAARLAGTPHSQRRSAAAASSASYVAQHGRVAILLKHTGEQPRCSLLSRSHPCSSSLHHRRRLRQRQQQPEGSNLSCSSCRHRQVSYARARHVASTASPAPISLALNTLQQLPSQHQHRRQRASNEGECRSRAVLINWIPQALSARATRARLPARTAHTHARSTARCTAPSYPQGQLLPH